MDDNHIIAALDGLDTPTMEKLVVLLSDHVAGFKVNSAMDARGEEILGFLNEMGGIVFADAKLHDIPNTVANRMANYASMGADWVTVHASGGKKMIAAATDPEVCQDAKVLAVTVLTSLSTEECDEIYRAENIEQVLILANIAAKAGAWGIVCSVEETPYVREDPDLAELIIINAGIRPLKGDKKDDQARKATPSAAIKAGADFLVIGRPITGAENPLQAVLEINDEIKKAIYNDRK